MPYLQDLRAYVRLLVEKGVRINDYRPLQDFNP